MIQDVEEFRSKLQLQPLADRKVAMNGKIPLPVSESSQAVSAKVPLPGRLEGDGVEGWGREGRWIQTLATRARCKENRNALRFIKVERFSWDDIGPNSHERSPERENEWVVHIDRGSRANQKDIFGGPVSRQSPDESI